jgi:hypothetical protein
VAGVTGVAYWRKALALHSAWCSNREGERYTWPVGAKRTIYARGADLRHALLRGAYAPDSELSGADLRWANMSDANLRGSNLHTAALRLADLRYANLRYADLHGADLTRATLHGADLRGATLTGATLTDADLTGADLRGAVGLLTTVALAPPYASSYTQYDPGMLEALVLANLLTLQPRADKALDT